jgi:quercetin dioxygenase-like cupin family protein
LLLLVLEPGGGSGPEPWTRPGEKAGYVLEGTARLEIAGVSHELAPGDSFQFESSQPHRFVNTGDATAKILWIISSDPIARAVDA